MRAGRGPAKSRRAVAEVIAEVLLVAIVVSLTGVLIAFFAPLIPPQFPRPLSTGVGLGPATGGGDLFAIPVAYASDGPTLASVALFVQGPGGTDLGNSTWTAALWTSGGSIEGHYGPGTGWSAETPLTYLLASGDRFVVAFATPLTGSGYTFGLAGTGAWGGLVSVPLP